MCGEHTCPASPKLALCEEANNVDGLLNQARYIER